MDENETRLFLAEHQNFGLNTRFIADKIYQLDRPEWERLSEKYLIAAGVNPTWIAEMKKHTMQTDYY